MSPSPPVYTLTNLDGQFVAFWKSGETSLSIFQPSNMHQRFWVEDISQWGTIRDTYNGNDYEGEKYEDIVNAAWHYMGQHAIFIDRRKAKKSKMKPGVFYPRIWRGIFDRTNILSRYNPINPRHIYGARHIQSAVASASLFDYLSEVFKYIEPNRSNSSSFGHKIRELLILTCTEIEAGWRAILIENSSSKKLRYTTEDYFKTKDPLRLEQWSVMLRDYPDIGELTPFSGWDALRPTKSLSWYDAYNAVKHNREAEFPKATLESLLGAMAALHIMQAAQWGPEIYSFFHDNCFSPFEIVNGPEFVPSEIYLPSLDQNHSFMSGRYFDT